MNNEMTLMQTLEQNPPFDGPMATLYSAIADGRVSFLGAKIEQSEWAGLCVFDAPGYIGNGMEQCEFIRSSLASYDQMAHHLRKAYDTRLDMPVRAMNAVRYLLWCKTVEEVIPETYADLDFLKDLIRYDPTAIFLYNTHCVDFPDQSVYESFIRTGNTLHAQAYRASWLGKIFQEWPEPYRWVEIHNLPINTE